jgi:putative ABC transport system permease protein
VLAFLNDWIPASPLIDGLVYGLLALGVFLTFRILNFADLTVDSSFTTGAATAAIIITNGGNPWLATLAGFVAGAMAGAITGLLHTKLKIDPLLSSILTMIALWSVNLHIMGLPELKGKAQVAIGRDGVTVFSPLREVGLYGNYWMVLILVVVVGLFIYGVTWFLGTNFGLAVQATGDNPGMATSFGVSIDNAKIATLMLSNGLVGLSGALTAQVSGTASVTMGVGLILAGLASVIVGNAILGLRYTILACAGVVVGSIIYRLVFLWATKIVSTVDMKFITAVLVVLALVISRPSTREAIAKLVKKKPRSKPDLPEDMMEVPPTEKALI